MEKIIDDIFLEAAAGAPIVLPAILNEIKKKLIDSIPFVERIDDESNRIYVRMPGSIEFIEYVKAEGE